MPLSKPKYDRLKFIYRFKHAFSIFLISFFVMLIVPSGISIYLYANVSRITESSSINNTLTMLDTVGTELRHILTEIDSAAYNVIYDTSLRNILNMSPPSDGDKGVIEYVKFINKLDDKLSNISNIHSGYRLLCRDNELIFYHNAMSSGLEAYYTNSMQYQNMTYESWLDTIFTTTTRTLLPADIINFGDHTAYTLTYSFPIITKKTSGNEVVAVLQFFIDVGTIENELTFLSESGSAFLVDSNGKILAHLGEDNSIVFSAQMPVNTDIAEYHGNDLFVRSAVTNDLYIFAVLPKSYALKSAYELRTPLLICLLLCFVTEALLSLYLARQNARPLERFASNVQSLLPGPSQRSEYAYLEQSIAQLRLSQQTTKTALEENRKLETSMLLYHLFDENYLDIDSLAALATHAGIDLHAEGYCVASIQSDQENLVLQNNLTIENVTSGLHYLYYQSHNKQASFLYLMDEPENQSSYDKIIRHLEQVQQSLHVPVRIGIGRIYPSVSDVAFSLRQSVYCLQQKSAQNHIAVYDTVSRNINAPFLRWSSSNACLTP